MPARVSRYYAEKIALQNKSGLSTNFSLHDLRTAYYGGLVSQRDATRAFLQSQLSNTTTQSLNDLWRLFFIFKGAANQVSLGDMATDFFTNIGFSNSRSLHFDGASSVVNVAHNAVFNTPLQAFTMECWVNPDALQTNSVQEFIKKDLQWILRMDIGIPKFIIWTANNAGLNVSGGTLTVGQWTHVAATYDGVNASLYVNGSRVAQVAATGNIVATTDAITLGFAASEGFPGFIKEVRISKSVRYAGASFTVPTAELVNDSNTLALYHFDDGSGTNLADTSGNALNGTLSGSTLPTWSNVVPF